MSLEVDSSSEALWARFQPGYHLDFGLVRSGAENLAKSMQNFSPTKNCEKINGCGFKPLRLC